MKIVNSLERVIEIDKKEIGQGKPIFIVIETGVTACGDLEKAKNLTRIAKDCGADAVKFQTIDCEEFMADRSVNFKYQTSDGPKEENMFEMLKKHQFSPAQLIELGRYAREIGISFYLSVDSIRSVEWAEDAGVCAYKIGSWDLRNFPLMEAVCKTGKPIQLDLGPVVLGEVVQVLEFLENNGAKEVMLVYCSHAEEMERLNLNSIPYLLDLIGVPVGYSADTREHVPDMMAIALGCSMIEKRLTLDKNEVGHHHIKALEPMELKVWIEAVRKAERALGEKELKPSIEDLSRKGLYFTSLVASRDIVIGEVITKDMLKAKRPGNGISPLYIEQMLGRKVNRTLLKDEVITWSDWGKFQ